MSSGTRVKFLELAGLVFSMLAGTLSRAGSSLVSRVFRVRPVWSSHSGTWCMDVPLDSISSKYC